MAETRRKIATLLAAEIADYERPAASSNRDIPAALAFSRATLLRLIEAHGGHCFSSSDQVFLAEFPDAANAVRCAVAVQQTLAREYDSAHPTEPVLLRIGLSVGDVSVEEGVLRGPGVDTAVGVRALAVPGGICLTGSIYEHVKHRVHVGFEQAGEKKLKNVPEPVNVCQVIEPGVEKGYFSIWEELKRRNVFRVGAAYAVVAWLLIQAASIVLPTFDTPPWIMQSVIVVTILGFPVAVVLAWLYELTPMGLKRSDEILRHTEIGGLRGRRLDGAIIGLLVVAVTFLAYDNYVSTAGQQANAEELDSIAVLAFENLSTEAEDEYFADGLADELLGALSRLQELKVASRTASFYFKGKDVDIMTIAATLQVGYVLSGRVRRYGDRIRVTAALDNAETSDLLWSESYDRELTDILDIQSEIARSVATAIVPVLSAQSEQQFMVRPTENAEAYDYYLRGRDYLRQPYEETTLASAIELFDRAIDLDARFAHAYAGLCEAHLGNYYFSEESDSFEAAEVACHRALTLDNSLWDVHVALGNLYRYSGQYEDAVLELETAIAQQPTAVSPYLELAQAYAAQNLLDQAEATFRRAEEVESRYWGVHNLFGNFLWDHSRYDEAIERYQRVIQLVPDSGVGYDNLGNTYLAMFELDQAENAFNASPLPSRWTYTNRGLVYYYRGEFSRAAEDHRRAVSISPEVHSSWGRLGDAYRFIPGEAENAHAAYEKAIELAEQELSINPSDWDTLARLNTYYAFSGQLDRAATGLERLFQLTSDPTAYYFAALVSVRLDDTERAYEYLRGTVARGWSRATIANDPDLASLHGETEFEAIIADPTQ